MSLGLLGAYISSDSDSSSDDEESKNIVNPAEDLKNKKVAFSNPFNNGAQGKFFFRGNNTSNLFL